MRLFYFILLIGFCFISCTKDIGPPPYKFLTRYGIVVDSNNIPLKDVKVTLIGKPSILISVERSNVNNYESTNNFVFTDSLGKYSISFEDEANVFLYLVASKDSFVSRERTVGSDHYEKYEMNFVLRKCKTCNRISYPPTLPFN